MTGRVIHEPVIVGRIGRRVFVEVHRDVCRRSRDAHSTARRLIESGGLAGNVDWDLVEAALRERTGIARDVTLAHRRP